MAEPRTPEEIRLERRERRLTTRRRLLARAWGWWLARIVFLGLTLYSCLFLLQAMALLSELGTAYGSSSIKVDPIEAVPVGSDLTLSGWARSDALLEVGMGSQVLATDRATDSRGRFDLTIQRPARALALWIRAVDRENGQQRGQREILLQEASPETYPLVVDIATQIVDLDQLWVAGQGPPGRILRIESNDAILGEVQSDAQGIFDILLEAETGLREVRVASDWGASPFVVVDATASALLPLARTADIQWTTTELRTRAEIILPATHPYFVALSEGSLPLDMFVERVFGLVPGIFESGQQLKLAVAEGKGRVRYGYEKQPSVLYETKVEVYRGGGKGIGSKPLLSGNDRITIDLGGKAPWLVPPMPAKLVGGQATWRGPMDKPYSKVVALGEDPRFSHEPQREGPPAKEKTEQRNLREFVQGFEGQVRANLLRQTWRTLIVLIPFLIVLFLARRARFGSAETWKRLAAAAAILAIWRSWGFLLDWLSAGPGSWLNRLIAPAVWGSGLVKFEWVRPWFQRFWETHANVFWLLFVTLIAIAPLYFDDAVRAGLRWRPRIVRRRRRAPWLRALARAFFGLRLAASALLLTVLFIVLRWLLSPQRWLYLEKLQKAFPDAWQPHWIPSNLAVAFGLLLLWTLLLLVLFGLRGALFAIGLLAVGARWAVEGSTGLDPEISGLVAEVPWWLVLAFAGLAALPFVARLLGTLVPFTRDQAGIRRLASAALVALSLLMPRLPTSWLLASAGALMVLGLGWVVVQGLPRVGVLAWLGSWADRTPASFLATLFAIGLALAWPFGVKRPGLVELGSFASELGQVFPYVLAAGVVLMLLDYAQGRQNLLLPPEILTVGGYLYAIFLLNSSATWLFVPVAFLTGLLLAGVWLFRPQDETDKLAAALPEGRRNLRPLIQSVIDSTELGSHFLKIRQVLIEKLEKMDLKPVEYEERLAEYQDYLTAKVNRRELPHGVEPRALVFAVGEPTIWDNTIAAVRWGAILSLIPLLIAVYQYLPSRGVSHAFPIMDLLTFLIGAMASWLLYAFFFGYFFVHLRGNSGLTKGNHLFSMVAIPFAVYHLLHAPTFQQVRPLLFWIAQVFLFFTLLGLLAFDYGLLRKNGFRFKDLRLVHDMPALSAYASTVVAAVVPAVIAVLTGEVKDVVSFFLENILPRVPS